MRTPSASLGLLVVLAAVATAAAPPALPSVDPSGDPLPQGAVARLGTSRFRCGCLDPADLALSADGKLVAALEYDGSPRIVLIDPDTGRRLRSFAAAGEQTHTIGFVAAGKELVCVGRESTVRVYDVAQGKEVRKFQAQKESLIVALSGDGRVLAAAVPPQRDKAEAAVYDVRTGKRLANLAPVHNVQLGLALSPEGKYLATYGAANETDDVKRQDVERLARTIHLWDVATGKEWKKIELEGERSIRCVAFSPDGKTLAIRTSAEILIWNLAAGKRLERWLAPSWNEARLTFSPDGKRLVMTTSQSTAAPAVWDLETNRRLRSARSPNGMVAAVSFRGGRIVALGLDWRALRIWDVLSGKRFDRDDDSPIVPFSAIQVRNGRIHTASAEAKLLAWDLSGRLIEKAQVLRDSCHRPRYVWATEEAVFSPDGSKLACAGSYHSGPTLYSVRSGEELFALPHAHERQVMVPAFSGDGKLLAAPAYESGRGTSVRIHRADSGKEVLRLATGFDFVGGLAIDPSGKRLAAALITQGDEEHTATVLAWRLDTGKQDGEFARYEVKGLRELWANCPLVFSPDGALLAFDAGLGTIHLLDGSTGKKRMVIENGSKSLLPAVFSPDGRSLAVVSGADASVLALWELRSGKKRWEATLPALPTALAFDPSGQLLISAHADTSALVWDLTGRSGMHRKRDADGWDVLVKDLSSADATKAFVAQRALAAGANLSVAEMTRRVKPAVGRPLSDKEIAALVKRLDDDDPEVRGKAADALEEQGKAAEAALRKALLGKPSAEVRRSATSLLEKLRHVSPEELRAARAVEVLEWIGTAEAKQMLADLVGGRADATLTLEAKAALSRLWK